MSALTAEERTELNQSNLSYATAGDVDGSALHSKSQAVLSQIHDSKNYGGIGAPSQTTQLTNNMQNHGGLKPNQLVNLNSYEIRKQSL